MSTNPTGRTRKPRRRWRWHVPPALTDSGESLEGAQILEEHPDALGLLLWETFRDVLLWAGVPEEERGGLFAPDAWAARRDAAGAAEAEAPVREMLLAASEVSRNAAGADPEAVMAACRGLAEWADRRGTPRTAVAMMTAGAVAAPAHAAAAFRAGQLAWKSGEPIRAETWFRRTVGLGRQARDWTAYAEAFLALASLNVQRGNYPEAHRFLVRALRAARRHGLRELQGRALHDLFTIGVRTGEASGGTAEYAAAAFRAYGPRHPRIPMLANDVAFYWLTQGHVQPALEVFRAVLPHLLDPSERVAGLGNLGRAAGAAGSRDSFDGAWDALWADAHAWDQQPAAAGALLDLAHGAGSLRDWSRAERAAAAAREVAQRMGVSRVEIDAEGVLDAVLRKRSAEPHPSARTPAREVEGLAGDLVRSLHTTAG